MIKLQKVIAQLENDVYICLEEALVKNKAQNFLFLLQSYRSGVTEEEIKKKLDINDNSFYVLKSRLFDKIQEHLSGDIFVNRQELLKKLNLIPEMSVQEPREKMMAFLQKIEKDLLQFDMHNELLLVYSALKKVNLYSDKYFYYSQLYNKHIAYSLSLEKSEEILGNFNRILGQYDFSRSEKLLETLLFLRKEITYHCNLHKSRQIEIIKNVLELQLCIFCNTAINKEVNIEELLNTTNRLIAELPETDSFKTWIPALEYLFFEYYYKIGNTKGAWEYHAKVRSNLNTLLLSSHICCTSNFLISEIAFLHEQNNIKYITEHPVKNFIYDVNDPHSHVLWGIYQAMISYYSLNYKDASVRFNKLINENSFKDFFHIQTDIKLSLAFIYIQLKEFDLADSLLKSINRKIRTEKIENYANVADITKVLELNIKQGGTKVTDKQKNYFALFMARNKNENLLLKHFVNELSSKYS
ncbi:MAG: hypothetical protein HYX39_01350 [Bacteroidetes bacterium]|nr:hypothetical protein [Bacteroidota bacterium]